ncbi:MAG: hypothetical protein QOF37_2266 [Thermoleophilaceae bacterium]|nr:hypothetical protein [Thermoleophilaceae bacterium]
MAALRRGLTGLAATIAALALLATGSAFGASVSLSGGALSYTGSASEANHVTFSFDLMHGVYVIQDTGVSTITVPAGAKGCHSSTAQIAYCDFGAVKSITAHLGNAGGFAQSKLSLTPVTLYAGTGNDTLIGGGGADTLIAGAGTDTLTAGSGNTRLVGGSGSTTMTGGSGHNTYQGGSGADTVKARNTVAEDISCAAGIDSVTADPTDSVAADCEAVDRGIATSVPGDPGPGAGGATALPPGIGDGLPAFQPPLPAISTAAVTLGSNDELPIGLACPAAVAGGCVGSIVITLPAAAQNKGTVAAARRVKRPVVSRIKRFHIRAGKTDVVPVVLSRRGGRTVRRSLRARNSLKLAVTVAMRSEAGTHNTTQTITVHAARRSGSKPKSRKRHG